MRRLLMVPLVLGLSLPLGLPTTSASAQVCDAYSGGCTSPTPKPTITRTATPRPSITGSPTPRRTVTSTPSVPSRVKKKKKLPVTGGELLLLFSGGVAAVGTGAALTAAGRRKR